MAPKFRDYTVGGPEAELAQEKGLLGAQWFVADIDRKTLRRFMQRDDVHATRDTAILVGLLLASFSLSYYFWTSRSYCLFALFFWIYSTLYTSCGDSRWHECGHGTAFKTKWKNDLVYNLASFMVFREALVWRYSHARHHTDTDIVGRDPEADGRPLSMWNLFLAFFNVQGIQGESKKLLMHARGSLSDSEKTFVPWSEKDGVIRQARLYLSIYALAILMSVMLRSPLPAMYVFLPYTLGAWHFVLTGVFQHASLAQDVLDHRHNTRTCLINPISAFIYWNMHYHVEHHMFLMVPYYNLPELYKILQAGGQMPKPYSSMWEVYREMIPDLIKQCSDPDHYTVRPVPEVQANDAHPAQADRSTSMTPDSNGWVAACMVDEVALGEFIRFDVGPRTYCVYHAEDDAQFYATDGKCTHGQADLEDGLIVEGNLIECPKHNGCFDFKTGQAKRRPALIALQTYPVRVEGDMVFVNIEAKSARDGKPKHMQIAYEKDESSTRANELAKPLLR